MRFVVLSDSHLLVILVSEVVIVVVIVIVLLITFSSPFIHIDLCCISFLSVIVVMPQRFWLDLHIHFSLWFTPIGEPFSYGTCRTFGSWFPVSILVILSINFTRVTTVSVQRRI